MPTLTELHDQRGQLVTEARSALDAITANTDDARATELEERIAQARQETSVEVDEGDFDEFQRSSRAWEDTVSPHAEAADR